jgi:hypothetical protein
MAGYSHGARTSGTASGAAAWELRTSSTDRPRVKTIKVTLATAVASLFGVGRPAAIGVTPTSPVTVLALDPAEPAGTSQTALAWGTGPTAPTAFLERAGLPGAIGNSYVFDFTWMPGGGLLVPVSSSIVLWNLQLNALFDVTVSLDE